MPRTIQIRVSDELYEGLRQRASEEGVSVPALLRAAAVRVAATPSVTSWLASTRRRSSDIGARAVVDALDALRGSRG